MRVPYCGCRECRMVWVECPDCDGTGEVPDVETDALCSLPPDSEPCSTCHGHGGGYVDPPVKERDGDAEEEAAVERRRLEREEEGRDA